MARGLNEGQPGDVPMEPGLRTLWRLELFLMACASFFHLVQLVIYPIDPKWFVALVGGVVYTTATVEIARNARFGYYLATGFPIFAGLFVVVMLALGARGGPGPMKFNPFTALAAGVELPAVILGVVLIRRSIWRGGAG